jgi:hypothetical protein
MTGELINAISQQLAGRRNGQIGKPETISRGTVGECVPAVSGECGVGPIPLQARHFLVRQSETGCLEVWHTFGCDVSAAIGSIDDQIAEAMRVPWKNADMRDDYIAMLLRLREYADATWVQIDDFVWSRDGRK